MRVRLAFAVAAHLDPEILILDEVLAVGDAKFQEKCLNRIDEIRKSGVTVLFVSHSAQQVLKLCTKGILLDQGKVAATGTAKELTAKYFESMSLSVAADTNEAGVDSRTGIFISKIVEFFSANLSGGKLVFNAPVETLDGVRVVDVGWISDARLQTLRTEPTWSAAPDIVVNFISPRLSEFHADNARHLFVKSGARESWVVWPTGVIGRYCPVSMQPILERIPKKLDLN
jgi:hypothetical protein